ncbi:MAG TPA: response regulator [Verrucomicrobiae bacterium]|nr:response regulator [Verrucomicrobiae bacterium]
MASSTILVVDDDIVVLTALSKLLNLFGYIVAGASNSQAAMDYVAHSRKRFDLIITDLAMPGIDGVQFMTAAKKVFPDIPIIVMTGYSERCNPQEALRLGAFAYVGKPFNIPEIVSTIERALRPASLATPQRPRRRPARHTPRSFAPNPIHNPASPLPPAPSASAS